MSRFFNVDVDSIINDHEISYQNTHDNFIKEFKQTYDKILKLYTQKVEDHNKVLKLLADENNKIVESCKILHKVAEKVEQEKQVLEAEKHRLESINNECRFFEDEEINLNSLVKETKEKESQVFQEKKSTIKKCKREINAFKTGVHMYEHFLQMSMDIEDNKSNPVINILLKNSKNSINYNIIFEECDNNFKLIDIKPCSQLVVDAAELYNQNNDVQGLLAFLYKLQTRNQ